MWSPGFSVNGPATSGSWLWTLDSRPWTDSLAGSRPKPNKHWAQNPPGLSAGMAVPHSLHVSPELMAVPYKRNGAQTLQPDSTAHHRDEVTNFFFHLGVGGNRPRDLLPQQSPEALTQSVNRNVNGAHADTAFSRQFRAGNIALTSGEESLQFIE